MRPVAVQAYDASNTGSASFLQSSESLGTIVGRRTVMRLSHKKVEAAVWPEGKLKDARTGEGLDLLKKSFSVPTSHG